MSGSHTRRAALALLLAACGAASTVPTPTFKPTAFSVTVTGSGPPVLFVPGLACSGSVWDATVRHLGGKVQAHVVTIAGFAGEKPIPVPILATVRQQLAEYVRANHLEHPVVVGHSMGGFLAYWLAETDPDLLGAIVVVDGLPFLPAIDHPDTKPKDSEPQAAALRDQIVHTPDLAGAMRMFLSRMISRPEDLEAVMAGAGRSDPTTVGTTIYEMMTTDLRPELARIRVPALIIAAGAGGDRTELEAGWHSQIDPIRNHRLVIIDGAKHFVMLDQPDRFFALLDELLAPRR